MQSALTLLLPHGFGASPLFFVLEPSLTDLGRLT